MEVEERFGASPVMDQPVERGEERDPVGHRTGDGVRMCLPFAVHPLYPECAEALSRK